MPIFDVNIRRTAVSWASMQIHAASEQAAREKALDQAGNQKYREKDAEYEIDSALQLTGCL